MELGLDVSAFVASLAQYDAPGAAAAAAAVAAAVFAEVGLALPEVERSATAGQTSRSRA